MTRSLHATGHVAKLVGMPTYSRHVGQGKHFQPLLPSFPLPCFLPNFVSHTPLANPARHLTLYHARAALCMRVRHNSAQVPLAVSRSSRTVAARRVLHWQGLFTRTGDGWCAWAAVRAQMSSLSIWPRMGGSPLRYPGMAQRLQLRSSPTRGSEGLITVQPRFPSPFVPGAGRRPWAVVRSCALRLSSEIMSCIANAAYELPLHTAIHASVRNTVSSPCHSEPFFRPIHRTCVDHEYPKL